MMVFRSRALLCLTAAWVKQTLAEENSSFVKDSVFQFPATCLSNNTNKNSNPIESRSCDSVARVFADEQIKSFEENGFLVATGLLDDHIESLVEAGNEFLSSSEKKKAYFSSLEMGMIFKAGSAANQSITDTFRHVALDSVIPQAVAELMRLAPDQKVRVLRDVFMSKSVAQDAVCDWHVDDVGLWPESFVSETEGINVWIAMEDMPSKFQGSMALSPGSHTATWRHEAYQSIGQNRTFHGGFTKEEIRQRAAAGEKLLTTCEMGRQAPELRKRIEETKYIPDIKKGDIIFATRSLFHRTVPVTPQGKAYYDSKGIQYLNRYSIRYVPGTATLPIGWTFEWSIATNQNNKGRTVDTAMETDHLLWYPEVWPNKEDARNEKLNLLASTKLEEAKSQTRSEFFQLISLFSPHQL